MKREGEVSLKQAIEQMINSYRLKGKMSEASLLGSWEQLMGPMIGKHTKDIQVRNRHLIVKLDSAALKQELIMMKSDIFEKIKREYPALEIKDILFL